MKPVAMYSDVRDELAALKAAAIQRIRDAAWAAKLACDQIPDQGAVNGKTHIEFARRSLDHAERHFNALQEYDALYRVAVKERAK